MKKQALVTAGRREPRQGNPATTRQHLVAQVVQTVPPPYSDVWIYRLVVGGLGLVILVSVVGAIVLSALSPGTPHIPEVLTALGSAAVGALAGLLTPFPSQRTL